MAYVMRGSPKDDGSIEGTTSWFEKILSLLNKKGHDYDPGFTINLTKEQEERIKNYDPGFSTKLTPEQEEKMKNYDKGFDKGFYKG